MHKSQRLINHVTLVLDGSSSMYNHTRKLIEVADDQIRHLALRSEELSQETRVSVYLFADSVQCLIFDMDVMRLPSIADLYKANGMTALIDAVFKSQQDLNSTSQIYGDHAFLSFVLTDGMENCSRHSAREFDILNQNTKENWTVAYLVPGRENVAYLKRLGVSEGNIAIWDTRSATGIADAVQVIRTATDSFMASRASGVRGSRNLFSTGVDAVNAQTVQTNLTPLDSRDYQLIPVRGKTRIDDFVNTWVGTYYPGMGYYELSKTETIQPQKEVIVLDKRNNNLYGGPQARSLIGLPNEAVRVKPDANPDFKIFVQSTSVNRNLMPNTQVLVRTR